MTSTIGIPIKLLNEAQGHIVTLEIDSGTTYRGKLIEGARPPKSPFPLLRVHPQMHTTTSSLSKKTLPHLSRKQDEETSFLSLFTNSLAHAPALLI